MIRDHIIKSSFNEMVMIFQGQAHNYKVDDFVKIKKNHKWLVMRFKKDKCVIRACLCHCASMC